MSEESGNGDGESFVALADGVDATADQAKIAGDWLAKNTENFDPKSLDGKSPTDLWNLARTGETEIRKRTADPWKGTPFEGQKIPDKFVTEKDGKKNVAVDKLVKSYGELERSSLRRREEIATELKAEQEALLAKKRPAAPGDYVAGEKMTFKTPDGSDREALGMTIGDRAIEIIQDDPALEFIKGVAHKHGVDQAEFNEIVKGYVTAAMMGGPKWENEAKALGGDLIAAKREQRVVGFLKANLSAENFGFFARMPTTASGVKAIEQLMELTGMPAFIPEKGDVPGETFTREELRKMQADPRYTGNRPGGVDKEFVKLVRAGFRKLATAA